MTFKSIICIILESYYQIINLQKRRFLKIFVLILIIF